MECCPCKTCEHVGCGIHHAECEKYLNWKREYDKIRECLRADISYAEYERERDLRVIRRKRNRRIK